MANEFLKRDYPVYFVERLPQRLPSTPLSDLRQWIFKKGYGNEQIINISPANLEVLGFRSLPPVQWLRLINRAILKNAFAPHQAKLQQGKILLISYTPTYTHIDLAALLRPSQSVYISVHNYDAFPVLPDLLKAEARIINSDTVLMADSAFNVARLKRLAALGKPVYQLPPGVDYSQFSRANTGRPSQYKSLCYFGGIGSHLDLELYNTLAETLEVTFIGVTDNQVKHLLSPRIKRMPPVPARELPDLLAAIDILGIFYKKSPYIDGVIPAKFFECLATGKPLLVSGMDETKPYSRMVYECGNSVHTALNIIASLPNTETAEQLSSRQKLARTACWDNRYAELMTALNCTT